MSTELPSQLNDWQMLLAPARDRLQAHLQQLRTHALAREAPPINEIESDAGKLLQADGKRSQGSSVGSADGGALGHTQDKKLQMEQLSERKEQKQKQKGEWEKKSADGGASGHTQKSADGGASGHTQERADGGALGHTQGSADGGALGHTQKSADGGASGHTGEPSPHQRRLKVWRVRGALASLGAHGLLLLLLGWMTLRLPSPPASLELNSAAVESTHDALEISQPLEQIAPDQAMENDVVQESFDAAGVLSHASSDLAPMLTGLATPLASGLPSHNLLSASSTGSGLPHSNATFFGSAASGNCFCYVIDGSGSMRNGPWEAARFELLKSLSSLTEKQRFYIIFFNRELSAIPLPGEQAPAPSALYATRENLAHTRRWLDTLSIGIGAPPNDALALAIDKQPDAIYLLTDGVTSVDVVQFVRERNRISDLIAGEQVRVPIHTIAFYSLDGQAMLQQLAAENAGRFTYVPDPRR